MAEYRYLFADLLTNQIKAELPLSGVKFGQQLNTSGQFSGQLLLSGLQSINYDVQNNTQPGRTALYVDRDGKIVWGGVVWSRSYDSSEQKLNYTAQEFESYFSRRRINYDYNVAGAAIDQLQVVRDLVNNAQGAAETPGNIGVVVGSETSSVTIAKTYRYYDLKPVSEAILELSQSSNGFDWNIHVDYDNAGNIVKTLRLGSPRLGTQYSATDSKAFVVEFPGNIIQYSYPEDGATMATTMYGIGSGTSDAKLISTQTSSYLTTGWPLLEDQVSYTDYSNATLLDNLTTGYLNARQQPVAVPQVVIASYVDPVLGTYACGDDFRIRIMDDRFPGGLDVTRRLSKYDVTVGDSGPEEVTLSFVVTPN